MPKIDSNDLAIAALKLLFAIRAIEQGASDKEVEELCDRVENAALSLETEQRSVTLNLIKGRR